jgi:superfamily II DNA or RNA helicase
LIQEQFGTEQTVLAGGYGYCQIRELVQNGADALLEAQANGSALDLSSRIYVQLCESRLYVANTGAPLDADGLDALLGSHSSSKRGNQIGRFGLGFKSLLKFNGRIDIFTRASGAIRFDPERCRDELRHRFQVEQAPGLRLAYPLKQDERAADPVCTELAWAETIIRVEVGSETLLKQVRHEIRSFPSEFLLFFPVTTTLTLDSGEEEVREVRLSIEGGEHTLHDGDVSTRWRIAEREVHITDQSAVDDATEIHARESVPISWAMPLQGRREESGRFWAFFPTQTPTHVPGILNAPWKLNSDRSAIIGGEWNAALMAEAARLIAETLPSLATAEDPARPLDAFPRQLDRKDEVAAPLVESIWKQLGSAEVIPDGTGVLRCAQELWRHPRDTLRLATAWQSLAETEQLRQLAHASCLRNSERASRLKELAKRIEAPATGQDSRALRRCSTESWFDLVASANPEAALGVLQLAKSFSKNEPDKWKNVRDTLSIVPTQSGKLLTAPKVVLAPESSSVPGHELVAAEFQSIPEARKILSDVLCVRELDDQTWKLILSEAFKRAGNLFGVSAEAAWADFWARVRLAPEAVHMSFLDEHRNSVRVHRRDGRWMIADRALVPGELVGNDDSLPNTNVLIDLETHKDDYRSLEVLGVADVPRGETNFTPEDFRREIFGDNPEHLSKWLELCRKHYYRQTQYYGAKKSFLLPGHSFSMPRGHELLEELTGASKAGFTLQLLDRLAEPVFEETVCFEHTGRTTYYPRIDVPHPLPWYLLEQGVVQLGSAYVPLRALIAQRTQTILRLLPEWSRIESALGPLNNALETVSVSEGDLHKFWEALIEALEGLVSNDSLEGDTLAGLWLGAARDGFVPTELPSPTGRIPLCATFVTTSADLAQRARNVGLLVVVLDPTTMQLWLDAGARDLEEVLGADWSAIAGPPERLIDVVPELGEFLLADAREAARCQQVTQLRLRITNTAHAAPCLMWDDTLFLDAEQLAPLSRAERLRYLLEEIASSEWLDGSPAKALEILGDAGVDERRAHVAQGATLAERLLRVAGNRVEPLLDALGQPLRDMDFVRQCTPQQLAKLVLRQLGPSALSAMRNTLQDEGLQPPARWNSPAALAFVAAIGFPPEFASTAEARREPEELVSGPINLPPLHDFQQEVFNGLESLLSSGTQRRRAVISLPTGGGKTRVTVEAAVQLVLSPSGALRTVLWIAQTDELCEQAVQAFRQVWVNHGAERTNLRIYRLWGKNCTPIRSEPDQPVVIVASIQTLNNRLYTVDLDWLRKPGLVVIDECHHAITPSYTRLLRWLDAEASRPGAAMKDEPPIVGLSATPFRTNDQESQRLARRFDKHWLPTNQEDLYERLLKMGVLAKATYEPLESGVKLTDDEQIRLEQLGEQWEGIDFENLLEAINRRLASDACRNQQLVERIQASTERSILIFSNSVAHAVEMAARLNHAGIDAAPISGRTPGVARRFFLDQFQKGEIRVLCNDSVLTTGFDAPRTDMVLIARQVFSRVRYMQMVGRGLRGELNGGTPTCRIVSVVDNLGRFQERHPYNYCSSLYSSPR